MKHLQSLTSACKYCRFYQPEGRRGGVCQQLEVHVKGSWKACNLARPPFPASWEKLEYVWKLPDVALTITSGLQEEIPTSVEKMSACTSHHVSAEQSVKSHLQQL